MVAFGVWDRTYILPLVWEVSFEELLCTSKQNKNPHGKELRVSYTGSKLALKEAKLLELELAL